MGTYELVRRVGVGGMGEVWLARQRGAAGFARDVAIKRLLPQAMEQPDVVSMFIEEAQVTGRLRHPNVVNVIELGAAESGELYLVLEYVDGTGLHKLLRQNDSRPSPIAALAIARDVALALHAAHTLKDEDGKDLGLVHRDVTPSNVMVDRNGHVKLMDFGIAKVRAKSNQTEAGIIKGKIAYLAPEQIRGEVDPRSDIFALGLVLWEVIAGQQARSGSSDAVMMAKVALEEVPSILKVVPDLAPEIAAVVDKAVATDPANRYQTGQEMVQGIQAALNALPERVTVETGREQLAELVVKATARESEQQGQSNTASRTIDGARPVALTLHSLVVQQDGVTISRSLDPSMIKAVLPPDARETTSSGTKTRMRRQARRSALLPLIAVVGAIAIVGVAVVMKKGGGTRQPNVESPRQLPVAANLQTLPVPVAEVAPTVSDAGAVPMAVAADAGATIAPTGPQVRSNTGRSNASAHSHGTNANGHATGSEVASDTPATLGVSARPWATVSIDGHELGDTPVRTSLAPGAHLVVLTNTERQVTRRVRLQLAPGEHRVINEDLTREN